MEMYRQLLDRDGTLIYQQIDNIDNLVGCSNPNCITQRKFIDAHFQQGLRHIEYLPGGDCTFIWTTEDGRDIATHGNAFLLCQSHDGTKVIQALLDGSIDIMTGETFTGGSKYRYRAHTSRNSPLHALQIGDEDRIRCRG